MSTARVNSIDTGGSSGCFMSTASVNLIDTGGSLRSTTHVNSFLQSVA
jgi:hypothetical protein